MWEASELQGVIKSYDPDTRQGAVITDTDRANYDLASLDRSSGCSARVSASFSTLMRRVGPPGFVSAQKWTWGPPHRRRA